MGSSRRPRHSSSMNKLFIVALAVLAALAQGGVVNREEAAVIEAKGDSDLFWEDVGNKLDELDDEDWEDVEDELEDEDWEDEEDELDEEDWEDDEDELDDEDWEDDEDEDDLEDDDDEDDEDYLEDDEDEEDDLEDDDW